MKMFSFVHVLLFLLCLLVCKCVSAQSDYVISLQGDTLHGEVKPLMFGATKQVQLNQEGKKKITYSVVEVRGFHYNNDDYQVVRDSKGYTFMKVIKRGYLSLYAFQLENQTSYDGRFLQKLDGTSLEVPNLSFKKQMTRFLEDCVVTDKIASGDLSRRDLEQIVDEYNDCIDKNTKASPAPAAAQTPAKTSPASTATSSAWDTLEKEVKNGKEFEGKSTALEMITEIKSKISRSEKIPNFLLSGLKETLSGQTDVKEALDAAIKTINN